MHRSEKIVEQRALQRRTARSLHLSAARLGAVKATKQNGRCAGIGRLILRVGGRLREIRAHGASRSVPHVLGGGVRGDADFAPDKSPLDVDSTSIPAASSRRETRATRNPRSRRIFERAETMRSAFLYATGQLDPVA